MELEANLKSCSGFATTATKLQIAAACCAAFRRFNQLVRTCPAAAPRAVIVGVMVRYFRKQANGLIGYAVDSPLFSTIRKKEKQMVPRFVHQARILVVGLLLCLSATANAANSGQLRSKGKALLQVNCGRCHAIGNIFLKVSLI